MKVNYFKLIMAIIITELIGMVGSFFTTPNITGWYNNLTKPKLAPPNWIFAPVWTILFLLMGIAVYLILQKDWKNKKGKTALIIFGIQLILNLCWSILFFGLHNPAGAFVEVVFLWVAILITIILFYRINKTAAWLLIPYIIWVTFAGYLNYSFVKINGTKPEIVIFQNEITTTTPNIPNNSNNTNIANPASTNCVKNGGNTVIEKKADGSEYGLCYFDDARACEEWAMLRGDCAVGGRKTTGFDTVEQKYCAWVGGETIADPNAICTFADGSTCELDKLYAGECQKGQNPKKKEVSKIIKKLETTCSEDKNCELPFEYAIKSSGPYSVACLNNKCAVVIYKY